MKAHRFECINKHVFFVPLNLPIDMMEFTKMASGMQCPVCHVGSEKITMNAKEFTIN